MSNKDRHPPRRHPLVREFAARLEAGRIGRRDFLRTVTLLGLSSGAAYALASKIEGRRLVEPAMAQAAPRRGGVFRVSMPVQEMADPATFDWTEKSNVARQIIEYLVITGPDNITRPWLAERWEPSDDLKVWTFYLRRGVKWHNGDDFIAEDVIYNFNRWLDPKTGSSNQALFAGLTEEYDTGEKNPDGTPKLGRRAREGAIERIDDHTVRLHLSQPTLSIPENLYNYPTPIVHRRFDEMGGDLSKNPIGTGPYTLAEFRVGELAVLQRVPGFDYWGEEPYLDEIRYIDHGPASAAQLAAFASGQVDMAYELDIASLGMAQRIPNGVIYEVQTAQTGTIRMRVTEKPFDDKRVRQAILACVDAARYPQLVYQGRAMEGEHHHVAPVHPEYFPLPKRKQDYELAKKLLAEAGHADGFEITADCGNTNGPWQQQVLEILQQQLAPVGIKLNINLMPPNQYWEIWTKTPLGITAWTHRPLGTMALSLGYRTGVTWNESAYSNPEFDQALDVAESLIDVEERKKAMEKVEKILQDDAVIVQPLWQPKFFIASPRVKNLTAHPTQYHQFNQVWIDESA